jgi:hypothetical protein
VRPELGRIRIRAGLVVGSGVAEGPRAGLEGERAAGWDGAWHPAARIATAMPIAPTHRTRFPLMSPARRLAAGRTFPGEDDPPTSGFGSRRRYQEGRSVPDRSPGHARPRARSDPPRRPAPGRPPDGPRGRADRPGAAPGRRHPGGRRADARRVRGAGLPGRRPPTGLDPGGRPGALADPGPGDRRPRPPARRRDDGDRGPRRRRGPSGRGLRGRGHDQGRLAPLGDGHRLPDAPRGRRPGLGRTRSGRPGGRRALAGRAGPGRRAVRRRRGRGPGQLQRRGRVLAV